MFDENAPQSTKRNENTNAFRAVHDAITALRARIIGLITAWSHKERYADLRSRARTLEAQLLVARRRLAACGGRQDGGGSRLPFPWKNHVRPFAVKYDLFTRVLEGLKALELVVHQKGRTSFRKVEFDPGEVIANRTGRSFLGDT
jgi:hypothetical protein